MEPSPIDHVTFRRVAVAVTDTPGTVAVADTGAHDAGAIHNQVGTFTICSAMGFIAITGEGR
ncbi:hypothetical protein OG948_58565 (plasmid) [Embleya sp. NBC_00888]|uniref:hypothetical protein n=1 Tax=Embleya sp. NBC_00888 TaxID=2975960 RepID=UPI002F9132BA|nr:hypothetical protein OG948_58565 [Embleya sp. NBC_00888]